jgi:hypothetical protein
MRYQIPLFAVLQEDLMEYDQHESDLVYIINYLKFIKSIKISCFNYL